MRSIGLPTYRGRQIYRWMYPRREARFEAMTDLPRDLREKLAHDYRIVRPDVVERNVSTDGTIKYLFGLEGGGQIETVYIPEPPPKNRHTFCLSTQIGCPLQCSFCFSGTIPLQRNVTPGEILGQFMLAREGLTVAPPRSNIVFMGMGEPLLNSKAVLKALNVLTDPEGLAVSPRRITVSTSGLADELERFAEKAPLIGIAISLHATTDSLRNRIMPINRRHAIDELMETARRLPLPRRRRITFEYVLLGEENDSPEDARRLAALLADVPAKVNLIAYNPWPGSPHRRSDVRTMERFQQILMDAGLTASLRRSRGDDVLAACGQLANQTPKRETAGRARTE